MDQGDMVGFRQKTASLGGADGDCQWPNPTKDWCLTKTNRSKQSFTWTIEDFSKRSEKNGQGFESSVFPTQNKDSIKWQLKLYPRGISDSDYISLYLKRIEGTEEEDESIRAEYRLSLLNNNYGMEQNKERTYRGSYHFSVNSRYGYERLMKRADLYGELLPGDKLTIFCEIEVFMGSSESYAPATTQSPPLKCTLSSDLWNSFEKQKLTDVVILVGAREFNAHKAILAARSPMFGGMFSHDMQESQSNRVELSDIEPEVFQEVLRYIYTGESRFTSTIEEDQEANENDNTKYSFTMELLKAATKYQLDNLKLICERRLVSMLSVDSVVEILSLADQHQAVWLKDRAIQFAIYHATELTKKGGWELLSKNNPGVLAQVIARQWPAKLHNKVG